MAPFSSGRWDARCIPQLHLLTCSIKPMNVTSVTKLSKYVSPLHDVLVKLLREEREDWGHGVWVLPLLLIHNSQVLSHNEPGGDKEGGHAEMGAIPPHLCSQSLWGGKEVVAPVCFIANASVTSKGTLRTFRDVWFTLSGGLRLGGRAAPLLFWQI